MSGRFARALAGEPLAVPPIWLMRQAGRYQARYQALRARHSFEALCRTPELSAEVALGAVLDFDFDAAILFSDLLFPLEALGMRLSYDDGPPKLDGPLTLERVRQFRPLEDAAARLVFQRDAMAATRAELPREKGLIGFVGGPWTLFVYAVEGTHAGALARAKSSLDLYRAFADRVVPLLKENIRLQLDGGADVVMVFDTAAGELAPDAFGRDIGPDLAALARAFPKQLGYYAKGVQAAHLAASGWHDAREGPVPWAGVGLDWHWDLAKALTANGRTGFVQGNFDPSRLLATGRQLEDDIARFVAPLRGLSPEARRGWICGLGHGVLPGTPEASVRTFVNRVRESFA
ncbi:MAG TPA: uroporphyrinogen decarboxylase family protein [Vicinamibacterales bacterium]|nr:uroporphyrinogen decarboxylase family protein [Vicinamibacterales bacterium]